MEFLRTVAEKLKRLNACWEAADTAELDQQVAAQAAFARAAGSATSEPSFETIIKEAWAVGQTIDLENIGYGPAHWKGGAQFLSTPNPYYFFLAGLVRSQGISRILEIGTHYGGSILSMVRGTLDPSKANIFTVDITDLNPELHRTPGLTKIVGAANSVTVIKRAALHFGHEPIDLLYIDADHHFLPTITSLSLFGMLFRPRFVVLDDIALYEDMRALWNVLGAVYGSGIINCVDVVPEIRSAACGFGMLRLR